MFEVASIKPNKSAAPTVYTNPLAYLPGGRFVATNVTLVDVIVHVYPTLRIQMQGGPDWIDSERFDIVAKANTAEGDVSRSRDSYPDLVLTALELLGFKLEKRKAPLDMTIMTNAEKPTEN